MKVRLCIALSVIASGLFAIAPQASADTTTIVVTTTKDVVDHEDGKCSLREAIDTANGDAVPSPPKGECRVGTSGDYRIVLDDKTYALTLAEPQRDDQNFAGDLDIHAMGLDIIGVPGTTIRQDAPDRVIDVHPTAGVFFKRVTITGGEAPDGRAAEPEHRNGETGGGIRSTGSLLLERVTVVGNEAGDGAIVESPGTGFGGGGGGIFSSGGLNITRSTIRDNRAGDGAAGAHADGRSNGTGGTGGIGGFGGGILALDGGATIRDSVITGNTAGAGGRGGNGGSGGIGGGDGGPGGQGGTGGGISVGGDTMIERTTIAGNAAGSGGTGGTGGNSGLAAGGRGGDGGTAGYGGGAEVNTDHGEISQTTIATNATGAPGAGGAAGNGTSAGTTGDTGIGGSGGGLLAEGVQFNVLNSTLSGNQAIGGHGGGIYNVAQLRTNNLTVANNGAVRGGGLHNVAQVVVHNSTLGDNTATDDGPDCVGTINSNGRNLVENPESCAGFEAGDLTGIDPELGPLKDNGGRTQTHAITKSSPAYNAAEQAGPGTIVGSCLPIDQRGKKRKACDIGAYEWVKR